MSRPRTVPTVQVDNDRLRVTKVVPVEEEGSDVVALVYVEAA